MFHLHENQNHFREALSFTEATTTFSTRLVEKDYYCSLLLEYLAEKVPALVFKGGTCLAKVHTSFFRLSEDLDFTMHTAEGSARTQRRKLVSPMKEAFNGLTRILPCFRIKESLKGANNSTQYVGIVSYKSLATGQDETIKIEAALREPLITPAIQDKARTMLLNPLTGQPMLADIPVVCISMIEAFAEKFRAALSRRETAVRDFFDLDYAIRLMDLNVNDPELVKLVRQKLSVAGNAPVNVSEQRMSELRQQVEPELQPVLRTDDFVKFDVERAFRLVADMAARVSR